MKQMRAYVHFLEYPFLWPQKNDVNEFVHCAQFVVIVLSPAEPAYPIRDENFFRATTWLVYLQSLDFDS